MKRWFVVEKWVWEGDFVLEGGMNRRSLHFASLRSG